MSSASKSVKDTAAVARDSESARKVVLLFHQVEHADAWDCKLLYNLDTTFEEVYCLMCDVNYSFTLNASITVSVY